MTTFTIKIIAIITMIIDHVGLFFFPHILLFRAVGRLSFPLFAWLIANGAIHTRNINNYAIRLFLLALISQIPFLYANLQENPSFEGLNVVFTLFLGLCVITVMKQSSRKVIWVLATIGALVLSDVLRTDYGAAGILTIISYYLFYNKLNKMILAQVVILFFFPYVTIFFEASRHIDLSFYYLDSFYEFLGLFSLIFIAKYNKKKGHQARYLFYSFYPLQYVVILIMQLSFAAK